MNTTNPFEAPQFQELLQLEQRRDDILSRLEANGLLTPALKTAYARGLDIIGDQIIQTVRQSDFQDEVISYGEAAVQNLEGLGLLEGVLPEAEIEPLRTEFTQRLDMVRNFLRRYSELLSDRGRLLLEQSLGEVAVVGGLSPIVPQVSVEREPELPELKEEPRVAAVPSETVGELTPLQLPLTIIGNIIQVGKHGKVVPFSKKRQEQQRDYGLARRHALETLLENQGRVLKTQELKDAIGEPDMTGNNFQHVRTWLLSLTYRKQPLIEMVQAGSATVYRASARFEFLLSETEVKKAPLEEKELLDKGDVWIAARQLNYYKPMLDNLGIPTLDEKIEEALKEYMPDYSHLKDNRQAIRAEREAALTRIYEFLDDEPRFLSYLDGAKKGTPDYEFVEYLFDLEADQRETLKAIMRAVDVYREDRPDGYIMVAVDAEGKEVASTRLVTDRSPTPFEQFLLPNMEPPAIEGNAQPDKSPDETASAISPGYPDKGEIERPKRDRLSKQDRLRLDAIRLAAEKIAETYLEFYNPQSTYRRDSLVPHFPKLTKINVASAIENNVVPSASRGNVARKLSIYDVVNVLICAVPELRNIYSNTKLRKQVRYVIMKTIEQEIEKQKDKQS